MANPCGKTRPVSDPYEVWEAPGFVWKVLKKYKGQESEDKDPYARWFCAVEGPGTFGGYDMGDVYVREITRYGRRTS